MEMNHLAPVRLEIQLLEKSCRKNVFDMYSSFANERLKVNHDMGLKKTTKIRRAVSAVWYH